METINLVSVVITVKNEERTISRLLESLQKQTVLPSEIIIVDGGSTDRTISRIREFVGQSKKFGKSIKVFVQSGFSIARGRNHGILHARYSVIALTDAGCVLDKNWLSIITKPFNNTKVRVVAGFYHMKAQSNFQKALAPFLGVMPQQFDKNHFLPSTRSLALRKSVWKKIGGFDERLLKTSEDTVFVHELINHKILITREPRAVVRWEVPSTVKEACKKFYWYAYGDAQSRIWWDNEKKFRTHMVKIFSIFVRYAAFIALLLVSLEKNTIWYGFGGMAVYMGWSVFKMRRLVPIKALLWVPIIQIVSDFTVMGGFLKGITSIFTTAGPAARQPHIHPQRGPRLWGPPISRHPRG